MKRLTAVCLLLLLALSGCATPPAQPESLAELAATNLDRVRAADALPPREPETAPQSGTVPMRSEPALFPGNDRLVRTTPTRSRVEVAGEDVTLRFERAPLNEVVHAILGELLTLDYTIMQPLEGEVSLHTHNPVPRAQILDILESMLQTNGYVMQADEHGRLTIGRRDEMRANVPLPAVPDALPSGYSSVIVPLRYISAAEMAEILQPVSAPENFLRVDTARNLLMLAGTRSQIDGWLEIVKIFDVDFLRGMSVGLFPLAYLSVDEAETALRSVLALGGAPTAPAAGPLATAPQEAAGAGGRQAPARAGPIALPGPLAGLVQVLPIERLNALLVITPRARYLEQARLWIERLDRPADSEADKQLFVYPVQNGMADHIANVLNGVFGAGGTGTLAPRRRAGTGVAPGLSSGRVGSGDMLAAVGETTPVDQPETTQVSLEDEVRVVADERNNALIIYASRREYRRIAAALRQLDVAATQVLIEASILEVTLNDELQYGLQWFFSNTLGDGYTGSGQLTRNALGNIGPVNPGFSYSIASPTGSFRAVLSALAEKSLLNVISTPTMMVLDNHTAVIRVGDQQPIRTSETIFTDSENITSTIEYKDTGIMLEVTPSVNAGGMVAMTVRQSVIDVGQIDIATGQRTFLARDLASRVAVRSGDTVILGGLIRDDNQSDRQGVPVLHDLPVIGNLFGSTVVSADRTELLVMITPRVIRSEQDLRDVTREMRDRMRRLRDLPRRVSGDLGTEGEPVGDGGLPVSDGGPSPEGF